MTIKQNTIADLTTQAAYIDKLTDLKKYLKEQGFEAKIVRDTSGEMIVCLSIYRNEAGMYHEDK